MCLATWGGKGVSGLFPYHLVPRFLIFSVIIVIVYGWVQQLYFLFAFLADTAALSFLPVSDTWSTEKPIWQTTMVLMCHPGLTVCISYSQPGWQIWELHPAWSHSQYSPSDSCWQCVVRAGEVIEESLVNACRRVINKEFLWLMLSLLKFSIFCR